MAREEIERQIAEAANAEAARAIVEAQKAIQDAAEDKVQELTGNSGSTADIDAQRAIAIEARELAQKAMERATELQSAAERSAAADARNAARAASGGDSASRGPQQRSGGDAPKPKPGGKKDISTKDMLKYVALRGASSGLVGAGIVLAAAVVGGLGYGAVKGGSWLKNKIKHRNKGNADDFQDKFADLHNENFKDLQKSPDGCRKLAEASKAAAEYLRAEPGSDERRAIAEANDFGKGMEKYLQDLEKHLGEEGTEKAANRLEESAGELEQKAAGIERAASRFDAGDDDTASVTSSATDASTDSRGSADTDHTADTGHTADTDHTADTGHTADTHGWARRDDADLDDMNTGGAVELTDFSARRGGGMAERLAEHGVGGVGADSTASPATPGGVGDR